MEVIKVIVFLDLADYQLDEVLLKLFQTMASSSISWAISAFCSRLVPGEAWAKSALLPRSLVGPALWLVHPGWVRLLRVPVPWRGLVHRCSLGYPVSWQLLLWSDWVAAPVVFVGDDPVGVVCGPGSDLLLVGEISVGSIIIELLNIRGQTICLTENL